MKNIAIIIISIFGLQLTNSQQIVTNDDFEKIVFEVGMLYPLGKLKQQIAPMPNIGLWYKMRIKGENFAELGFNTSIMNGLQSFNVQRSDSIFRVKPRGLGGMLGVRFIKNYRMSKHTSVEWIPSIGYAFMMYKGNFIAFADKNDTRIITDDSLSKNLDGIHLGQGIRLNYDNVGVQIHYQFTPYSAFTNDVSKNFGNQSLIFGLVYRQ